MRILFTANRSDTAPLAQLVHEKTTGNPFFAIQFLSALAEEGLLTFDHGAARWSWDLDRIHAKGYTDNVVDLMVGKLNRLPARNSDGIAAACLSRQQRRVRHCWRWSTRARRRRVHATLWDAVRIGLVFRSEGSYRFLHDRVQEAAYSLIPEERRGAGSSSNRQAARGAYPSREAGGGIFEIVNQLNRGAHLITSTDEREQLAELNLIAGKRAKSLDGLRLGARISRRRPALLPEDTGSAGMSLSFALELQPGRMRDS